MRLEMKTKFPKALCGPTIAIAENKYRLRESDANDKITLR